MRGSLRSRRFGPPGRRLNRSMPVGLFFDRCSPIRLCLKGFLLVYAPGANIYGGPETEVPRHPRVARRVFLLIYMRGISRACFCVPTALARNPDSSDSPASSGILGILGRVFLLIYMSGISRVYFGVPISLA